MNPAAKIEQNALLVFAAVAETGGSTAAADKLGVAKVKVSLDIGRLESRLGSSLFHRTTRKVVLTDAGAALYQQSVPPLRTVVDALGQVAKGGGEIAGALRIACTNETAVQSVAPAVAAFADLHPRLRIEIRSNDRVVDLLAEGLDLAFRVGWLRDSSLRAIKMSTFEQHVLASPAYLKRAGTPKRPEDLAAHDWIALSLLPTPLTCKFTSPDGDARTVRMKARLSADAPATMLALLEAGAGVSAIHAPSAADAVRNGGPRRLLPRWTLPEGGIYAVFRRAGTCLPAYGPSSSSTARFWRGRAARALPKRYANRLGVAGYSPVP